jgi:hypothetical protein
MTYRRMSALVAGAVVMFLCGCQHYAVTDTNTGSTYYTKKVHYTHEGVATLTDRKTGNEVTVQKPEVKEISEREYKEAVGKK